MHILDLTSYYPPHRGGVEQFAHGLHAALVDASPAVRVTVVTSNHGCAGPDAREHPRIEVLRYPAWEPVTSLSVPFPRAVARALRGLESAPDIVVTHTRFYPASHLGGRVAQSFDAPWIHIEHGSTAVRAGGRFVRGAALAVDATLGRRTLRGADQVIAISGAVRDFVASHGRPGCVLLRRGIDVTEAPPSTEPSIVFVGRLVDAKGVDDLLHAFSRSRLAGGGAHLVVVGDGPDRAALARVAERLGVSDHVEFTGALDHEAALARIRRARLFVNPSHSEGLPTTVLEAAAMGVPVVATDVGGTREIVHDGSTGWLVPAQDVERLATALSEAMADPGEAARRGLAAADHVRETFNWAATARQFLELCSTLVGESRRRTR